MSFKIIFNTSTVLWSEFKHTISMKLMGGFKYKYRDTEFCLCELNMFETVVSVHDFLYFTKLIHKQNMLNQYYLLKK